MKKTISFLVIFAVILSVIPVYADSYSSSDEGPVYLSNYGDSEEDGSNESGKSREVYRSSFAYSPSTITAEVLKGMNATFGSSSCTTATKKAHSFALVSTTTTYVAPVVSKKEMTVEYVIPPYFAQHAVLRIYSGNFDVYEIYSLPVTMGIDLSYDIKYENQNLPIQPYISLNMNHVGRYIGGIELSLPSNTVRFGGGIMHTENGVMGIAETKLTTVPRNVPVRNELTISIVRADSLRLQDTFMVFVRKVGIGFVDKELIFLKPQVGKYSYLYERGLTVLYTIQQNSLYTVYIAGEGLIDRQYENVYSGEVGVHF